MVLTWLRFPLLLLTLGFSLFTSAQKEVTLRIVQTSDVHGTLFPFDYINNKAIDYGLAQVSSYVDILRANPKQEVILLDNGDFLQGQPTVYYSNYVDTTEQHIVSKIMNYMAYDAASVGNHDIEAGPRLYNELIDEFTFPWLSANIVDTRSQLPYFKPYTIIEKRGIRVAVLGLTTPGISKWLHPQLWPHMHFNDMVESAKQWIDSIRINESPHVIVGLFHSGHDAFYGGGTPNEPLNENASLLVAQQVPGFDIILIGHDHDLTIKKVKNIEGDSVIVVDPGSHARYISDITINISVDEHDAVTKKTVNAQLIPMNKLIPNPNYVSIFSNFTDEVEEFVGRKIGYFSQSITTRDAYFGPSCFVNLIHSVQLGISKCDISFAAPLFFDATIDKGYVYMRDMFKLYSFENHLYIINLTGSEVQKYLEYSYSLWMNTMTSENDHMLLFQTDENNVPLLNSNGRATLKTHYYHFDSAAGIRYDVDLSKPAGSRVQILSMDDGSPFDAEKTYKVAVNSYRGNGGGGHFAHGVGLSDTELKSRVVSVSSKDMRYYLMNWIENCGRLEPATPQNWRIIPVEWAQQAVERDRQLLFGNQE